MEKNIIKIAEAEQEFEAVSAVAALNDEGIAATYKPSTDNNPIALPGAMGLPDSFDIFVSDGSAEKAKDVLISIGVITPAEDDEPTTADTADNIETEAAEKEDATQQSLNDLMPENPVLAAIYKVVFALLALTAIGVFVWLCDTVIAKVMELFK